MTLADILINITHINYCIANLPMATIAFLGLGLMGSRMSRRLSAAGHQLLLWNRTPRPDLPLPAHAKWVATPAAACCADIIMCCVSDGAAMQDIVFGEQGIASAGRRDPLLVDFSSISPKLTRKMAHRLHQTNGMHWVDAPVSGGTQGAEQGRLIIMAGGREEDVARLRPLTLPLAQKLTHMGEVGAGQTSKLCNQLIVASNALLIAEAVHLARRSGVDARALAPALSGGFADSLPLQILAPRMAEGRFEPVQWKVSTLLKDLDNALALAEDCDATLPLAQRARELMARHTASGFADADLSSLINSYGAISC